MANIVAITSCPTGIAHTFMAAEGLEQGAKALGDTIKVETQGSVGVHNISNLRLIFSKRTWSSSPPIPK